MSGLEWLLISALVVALIIIVRLWLELKAERADNESWREQNDAVLDAYTQKTYGKLFR